jgi:hypothetical protein
MPWFPAFAPASQNLHSNLEILSNFNFLTCKQYHYYHFESTILNLNLKPLLHPPTTLLSSPAVRSLHTPISTSQKSESRKQEEGVIKKKNSQLDPPLHPHSEISPTQLPAHTPELQ